MNRVSSAVTAGLVMSAAGLLIALAATFRLVQTGLFSGDYVAPGQLDFEAVAFAVLGIGLFVSGLSLALVALADRLLGALPADEAVSSSQSVEEALQAPADQGTVVPRSTPPARASSAPDSAGYEPARHASVEDEPRGYVPEGRAPAVRAPVADAPVGPSTADRLRARGATMAAGAGPIARSGWDRVRSGSRAAGAATAATARATGDGVRRASSAAAARARENARVLGAAREVDRQRDLEREEALTSARAKLIADRGSPTAPPPVTPRPVTPPSATPRPVTQASATPPTAETPTGSGTRLR